jgi:hypothetical protein
MTAAVSVVMAAKYRINVAGRKRLSKRENLYGNGVAAGVGWRLGEGAASASASAASAQIDSGQ